MFVFAHYFRECGGKEVDVKMPNERTSYTKQYQFVHRTMNEQVGGATLTCMVAGSLFLFLLLLFMDGFFFAIFYFNEWMNVVIIQLEKNPVN